MAYARRAAPELLSPNRPQIGRYEHAMWTAAGLEASLITEKLVTR
jgi:hypothetical protein